MRGRGKTSRCDGLFIAFAPAVEPRIAVAVVSGNGGSGGTQDNGLLSYRLC